MICKLRSIACLLTLLCSLIAKAQNGEKNVAYLFVYFTGNEAEQEQIHYALSEDGYNYTPLNNGNPVITSDTIALTGCVRDPHILRGEDGKTFYMVLTDMRSSLGWASNRGLILMRSTDLVNWTHHAVHFPTRYPKQWANVTHVWAPETVYDPQARRYMVYYSLLTSKSGDHDRLYYSYVNDDFTDLLGTPALLFDNGKYTIDGNIVKSAADNKYHMFFKGEVNKVPGIYQATATQLTAPQGAAPGSQWTQIDTPVQQTTKAVEGVGVSPTLDGDGYIVMYDCYSSGHYQFCQSADLNTFKFVQDTPTKGKFTPRHGTIIPITQAEKDRLVRQYPNTVNPILPGYHADPEVLYSHLTGKYYVYTTSDGLPGWGGWTFTAYSSTDLTQWTDEGTVLDVRSDQVPWATGNAWAPAIDEVRQADGTYTYYLYYSANTGKSKAIGVASSKSPTGPFTDHGKPIIDQSPVGHGQQIDVDVFTDPKTGKHYIYWGNGYMAGAELDADMTTIKGDVHTLTPDGGTLQTYAYREAPYVFYRKPYYYFLWSVDDTGSPNYHVCYGVSKSPLGPIEKIDGTYPTILQQSPDDQLYGTAHNSVLQIPGTDQWRIVYHRIEPKHLHDQPGTHRQTCIDNLTFDRKHRIVPVVPTHNPNPAPQH